MKEKRKINNIVGLMSVIGLALLLLLSPCKVRNYIESQLGLAQTEVANKSQATTINSNCIAIEFGKTNVTTSKNSIQLQPILSLSNFKIITSNDYAEKSDSHYTIRKHSISYVPLYILHQNFKAHL